MLKRDPGRRSNPVFCYSLQFETGMPPMHRLQSRWHRGLIDVAAALGWHVWVGTVSTLQPIGNCHCRPLLSHVWKLVNCSKQHGKQCWWLDWCCYPLLVHVWNLVNILASVETVCWRLPCEMKQGTHSSHLAWPVTMCYDFLVFRKVTFITLYARPIYHVIS